MPHKPVWTAAYSKPNTCFEQNNSKDKIFLTLPYAWTAHFSAFGWWIFSSLIKEANCVFSQILNFTKGSILLKTYYSVFPTSPMILPPLPSRIISQLFACLVMIKLNHHLYLICRGLWDLVANQMCAIKLDTTRNIPINPLWASTCSLTFLFAFYKFMSSQLLCEKPDLAKERSLFIFNPNWDLKFSQVFLVRNESHLFCIRDCCACVWFHMRRKN